MLRQDVVQCAFAPNTPPPPPPPPPPAPAPPAPASPTAAAPGSPIPTAPASHDHGGEPPGDLCRGGGEE
ncbi:unnamed protein product [Closterium sp. Yama58-4]|nr:unnamed protein product [Closterium sp. Yama58-4]